MSIRSSLIVLCLALATGIVFGVLGALIWVRARPAAAAELRPLPSVNVSADKLQGAEREDFVLLVAEAFESNGDLALARERLKRIQAEDLTGAVESLASGYGGEQAPAGIKLAVLAVALGSQNKNVIARAQGAGIKPGAQVVATTSIPSTPASPRANGTNASVTPALGSKLAAGIPTALPASTRPKSPVPAVETGQNAPAPIIPQSSITPFPTLTPFPTWTPRPTNTPFPTARPTVRPTDRPPATAVLAAAPEPGTEFDPPLAQIRNLSFQPAGVAPGQSYWHLTQVVYCDIGEKNYGCLDRPGGGAGTSIYVNTGGADIDVVAGGINFGDRHDVIGDKKSPPDPCQCTFAFLVSDYRISVRGLPSDSVAGFCLCSSNGAPIPDGHAHVRYFLYFAQVKR